MMRLSFIRTVPTAEPKLSDGGFMLQNIRDNSQGWIAKTIIGLIIMLLALTGVETLFSSAQNAQEVARVNGEPVAQSELQHAINAQRAQLMQQLGAGFDPSLLRDELLRGSVLNGIIDRLLLLQATRNFGFAYSQAALDQVILDTPEFQIDGQFAASRFDQIIGQMGYTRMQFRQLLEQEMLIGQLRAGLMATAFSTDQQVEAFARLERQTRDFGFWTLPVAQQSVSVTDEEIKDYYTKHAAQFRSSEQVIVDYVALEKEAFFDQVTVDEAKVKALYEQKIANLSEQRRAAHILIEATTGEAEAKAKLEQIRTRLSQGEDFAALAKEFSEDLGSSAEGGDLGFVGKGVFDPAFEQAVYALKEGEISEPVKSRFGWHLIKLLGVKAAEIPSFDTLKPELVRELKTEQVEQRFVDATKQLETAAYESLDLKGPAQELGLSIQTTAAFGREGIGEGVTANPQFIQTAFSDGVLNEKLNSALIELDPETVVVMHLKQHLKADQLPLEQVKDQIAQKLKTEKAAEQVRQEGEAILTKLRSGELQDPPAVTTAATQVQAPEAVQPESAPVPEATPVVATAPAEDSTAVVAQAFEQKTETAAEVTEAAEAVVADEAKSDEPSPVVASATGEEAKPQSVWQVLEAAGRVQEGVDPAVMQVVFRLPKPTSDRPIYGHVVLSSGDFVIVRLDGVAEPDTKSLTQEQRQEYKRVLASRIGQQDFAAYMNLLRSTAEIKRF